MAKEGDTFIARGFDKMNQFTQKWEKRAFFAGASGTVAGAAIGPLAFIVPASVWIAMIGGGLFVADKVTEKMGNKVLEGFRLRKPDNARAQYSLQMNHGLDSKTHSVELKQDNVIDFPYQGRTRPDIAQIEPSKYQPRTISLPVAA